MFGNITFNFLFNRTGINKKYYKVTATLSRVCLADKKCDTLPL